MKYAYEAIDSSGIKITGVMDGETPQSVRMILSQRGFIPSKVEIDKGTTSLLSRIEDKLTSVKTQDLVLFTRQLRTMLNAGVPIIRILEVLELQTSNKKLKKISGLIATQIKEGSTLSEAMGKYPSVFSTLFRSMVAAGEASGALTEIMGRLIYMLEHEQKIKSDIKSALQYPVMVLVALVIAFFVLLTQVIPKFVAIFTRAGLKLPVPTKICMIMYKAVSQYWFITFGILGCVIVALILFLRTKQGRYTEISSFCKFHSFAH